MNLSVFSRFVFQISDNNDNIYGNRGYKFHFLSTSNEIDIELVTSQWSYTNRGFDLTWKGKCIPRMLLYSYSSIMSARTILAQERMLISVCIAIHLLSGVYLLQRNEVSNVCPFIN